MAKKSRKKVAKRVPMKKRSVKRRARTPLKVKTMQTHKSVPVKVKKVVLPPVGVVRMVVPASHVPVLVPGPLPGVVDIVPVKKAVVRQRGWFERLFG